MKETENKESTIEWKKAELSGEASLFLEDAEKTLGSPAMLKIVMEGGKEITYADFEDRECEVVPVDKKYKIFPTPTLPVRVKDSNIESLFRKYRTFEEARKKAYELGFDAHFSGIYGLGSIEDFGYPCNAKIADVKFKKLYTED